MNFSSYFKNRTFMQIMKETCYHAIYNHIKTSYNVIINSWNAQLKESLIFNFNKTPKHSADATYFYDFLLSSLSWIEEMRQSNKTSLITIIPHLEETHITKEMQGLIIIHRPTFLKFFRVHRNASYFELPLNFWLFYGLSIYHESRKGHIIMQHGRMTFFIQ